MSIFCFPTFANGTREGVIKEWLTRRAKLKQSATDASAVADASKTADDHRVAAKAHGKYYKTLQDRLTYHDEGFRKEGWDEVTHHMNKSFHHDGEANRIETDKVIEAEKKVAASHPTSLKDLTHSDTSWERSEQHIKQSHGYGHLERHDVFSLKTTKPAGQTIGEHLHKMFSVHPDVKPLIEAAEKDGWTHRETGLSGASGYSYPSAENIHARVMFTKPLPKRKKSAANESVDDKEDDVFANGTREGVIKGWDTKKREGHFAAVELHHKANRATDHALDFDEDDPKEGAAHGDAAAAHRAAQAAYQNLAKLSPEDDKILGYSREAEQHERWAKDHDKSADRWKRDGAVAAKQGAWILDNPHSHDNPEARAKWRDEFLSAHPKDHPDRAKAVDAEAKDAAQHERLKAHRERMENDPVYQKQKEREFRIAAFRRNKKSK